MKKILIGCSLLLSLNAFGTVQVKKPDTPKQNKVLTLQEADNFILSDENNSLIIDLTKHKQLIRVKGTSKRISVASLGKNKFLVKKKEKGTSSIFFEFENGNSKYETKQITLNVK